MQSEPIVNLVIGKSKAGKSTLINYLVGNNLTANDSGLGDGSFDIFSNGVPIGNEANSCTEHYHIIGDFCDTPGIMGISRNKEEQDKKSFEDLFEIYKAIKSISQLKIIIVIDKGTCTSNNGRDLIELLRYASEIPFNLQETIQGVRIVITKLPKNSRPPDLIRIIERFAPNENNFFVSAIRNGEVKISYFYQPLEISEGSFVFDQENREHLLYEFRELSPIEKDANKNGLIRQLYDLSKKLRNLESEFVYSKDLNLSYILSTEIKCKYFFLEGDLNINTKKFSLISDYFIVVQEGIPNKYKVTCSYNSAVYIKGEADEKEFNNVEISVVLSENFRKDLLNSELVQKNVSSGKKQAKVYIFTLKNTNLSLDLQFPIIPIVEERIFMITYQSFTEDLLEKIEEKKRKYNLKKSIVKQYKPNLVLIGKKTISENPPILISQPFFKDSVLCLSELGYEIQTDNLTIKADFILIIDKNIKITSESVQILAPVIITETNTCQVISFIGSPDMTVNFGLDTELFIGEENLKLEFSEMKPDFARYFPEDDSIYYEDYKYIRVESIFVNSFFKEHISMNNRAIELIAYINPEFGKLEKKPSLNIELENTVFYLKLYLNEQTDFKFRIQNKHVAFKACKDFEEYISKIKKINPDFFIPPDVKEKIEASLIETPPLFEYLINSKYTTHTESFKFLEDETLLLIKRYLDIYKDRNKNNLRLEEEFTQQMDQVLEMLGCRIDDTKGSCKKIYNYFPLNSSYSQELYMDCLDKFLAIFQRMLSDVQLKAILTSAYLSGDYSDYVKVSIAQRFTTRGAFVFIGNSGRMIGQQLLKKGVKRAIIKFFTAGVDQGVKQVARATIKGAAMQGARNAVKGAVLVSSLGITALMMGTELLVNKVYAHTTTGYIGKEYIL